MANTPPRVGNRDSGAQPVPTVITDARTGTSKEMASRQKRYAITMAFRTACFVSLIFVPRTVQWILVIGAVFLPYIAVILANQANTRTTSHSPKHSEPEVLPQISAAPLPQIIRGDIVEDRQPAPDEQSGWNQRVA